MDAPDKRRIAPKWLRTVTLVVIALCLGMLLGWDVFVANNATKFDTVSEMTMLACLRSLTLPFVLGYVAAHLTWYGRARKSARFVLIAGGCCFVSALLVDVLTWTGVLQWWGLAWLRRWPVVTFCVAFPLGHVLWPQVRPSRSA